MRTIRVDFEALDMGVDIYPATSDNQLYTEYLEELIHPHRFALSIDRLSDKAASQLLAEAYAKTVVAKYEDLDGAGWVQWFLDHPVEFHQLIYIAQHPDQWEEWSRGSQ